MEITSLTKEQREIYSIIILEYIDNHGKAKRPELIKALKEVIPECTMQTALAGTVLLHAGTSTYIECQGHRWGLTDTGRAKLKKGILK